jgi:glycosyltransferase involved in cell wall biosynthesis
MKNVLWISAMAPYDKVPHAGGKIHNWYLKKLKTSDDLNIKVATFCKPDEVSKIDLNEYKIDYEVYVRPRGGFFNEFKRVIAFASKLLVFNRYAGLVPTDYQAGMKYLVQRIESSGFIPDVVVLQWTEILFFLPLFKCTWPDAKFLAIEEDVSYLGQLRRAEYFRNVFLGSFFRIKSKKVKELEINYLNSVDYVVFNNEKDLQLATQDGFRNQHFVWAPFFQKSVDDISVNVSNTVVFYGAMNREENWKSAIWFIERVMPLIEDLDIVFEIVGANPAKKLYKYKSEKVIIKGFVADIQNELKRALCMAAPLVLGAGIKIKIIEAMSVGIPILTNKIGIEGIPATDGKEFLFCESPDDYAKAIRLLLGDNCARKKIADAAKLFIDDRFDFEEDSKVFCEIIKCI